MGNRYGRERGEWQGRFWLSYQAVIRSNCNFFGEEGWGEFIMLSPSQDISPCDPYNLEYYHYYHHHRHPPLRNQFPTLANRYFILWGKGPAEGILDALILFYFTSSWQPSNLLKLLNPSHQTWLTFTFNLMAIAPIRIQSGANGGARGDTKIKWGGPHFYIALHSHSQLPSSKSNQMNRSPLKHDPFPPPPLPYGVMKRALIILPFPEGRGNKNVKNYPHYYTSLHYGEHFPPWYLFHYYYSFHNRDLENCWRDCSFMRLCSLERRKSLMGELEE